MDPSSSSDLSPQSKRHSFPAILTYSETLSVLSEHQRQYNDREATRRSNTPTINPKGSDEERKQKLQQAMDWLKQELKDMYHQDKFLLRQFNHINRSIQDLKDKQEIKEEATGRQLKSGEVKQEQLKLEKQKQSKELGKSQLKSGQLKQEQSKQEQKHSQAKITQEQLKQELKKSQMKINLEQLKEELKKTQIKNEKVKQEERKVEELNQDKRSLNEYDSDYGSDQSMDKFEEDNQPLKNNVILHVSPKPVPKQRTNKRWTWWK